MHSVVVGLGKTGASCLRYLSRHGIAASATDSRPVPPGLAELGELAKSADLRLGGFDLSLLDGASQVLMSPGVPLDEPIARAARARGIDDGQREAVEFTRGCDRRMAADDALDERRSAARQSDDEDRRFDARVRRRRGRPGRERLHDPLDRRHVGRNVILKMFAPPPGAEPQLRE